MAAAPPWAPVNAPDAIRTLERVGILPVSTIQSVDSALSMVDALADGGLPVVEVTLRSEAAIDAISAISRERSEIMLAAGTVLNTSQARGAIDAGAQCIVCPGTFPDVIRFCQDRGVPVVPGVSTATEVGTALALGEQVLKFFPAELCGGVATLKAFGAVYPSVSFVPTGGIHASNLKTYLAAPQVLACGGSWIVPSDAVALGDYKRIQHLAREATATVREVRT